MISRFRARPVGALVTLVLALASPVGAATWAIRDPGQGPVALPAGTTGATNLSGLAWVGGDQWLAIADKGGAMYPLTISIGSDGRISAAALGAGTVLAGATDAEGIAWDDARGTVFVSDESGPSVREFDPVTGALVGSVGLPSVFSAIRGNLALESLSRDPASRSLWTANEEALVPDGPVSSFTAGTAVRLQRFDGSAGFAPSGQWAWVTDPIGSNYGSPGRDIETSGVVDLVAMPAGDLLVLERSAGGSGLRSRLFQAGFDGATDTTGLAGLDGRTWTPLRKSLLWSKTFFLQNFEGAALGPTLPDGSRSLLLVSDDGSGLLQYLHALVVRVSACGDGVVDAPAESCDDGNLADGDGCTTSCAVERCGDGARNDRGREECEDGNTTAGDGCSPECRLEKPAKACRDAIRKGAANYAKQRRKALLRCRDQLNAGAILTASADPGNVIADPGLCPEESGASAAISDAAARLRDAVAKPGAPKCDAASLAVLDGCAATVEGLVTADGSGGCLVASHDAAVDQMVDDEYGRRLDAVESGLRKCQEAIAKLAGKYADAREKSVASCRKKLLGGGALWFDDERTLPLFDPADCGSEAGAVRKLAAAGSSLRSKAESSGGCSDAALASLATACATTLDGLATPAGDAGCIVTGHDAAVDALLAARP